MEAQGRFAAIASLAVHLRRGCGLRRDRGGRAILRASVRYVADLGLVPFDDAAQRLRRVDEQVPAIRDLRRRRRSRARGLGLEAVMDLSAVRLR